jgi:hypothetical protein
MLLGAFDIRRICITSHFLESVPMSAKAPVAGTITLAFGLVLSLFSITRDCSAQAAPVVDNGSSRITDIHISPVIGFNFSLEYSAQHNSSTGWANIVTPDLSYRFNRHLSVDASIPWYPTLNANIKATKAGVTTYPLESGRNLLGDANLGGHLQFEPGKSMYLLNTTVGLDTGNDRFGLSADATTYNFTNHFERELGPFTPDIEVGFGNSSALANQGVRKSYVAVGSIANFQVGTSIDLPFNFGLDLEAYEDLPVGNQNVYGTITRKNKKGKTVSKQVLEGTGVAEDNGFNSELDLPVGHHVIVNGTYERSLIQGLDTVSVGVTLTLRAPKIPTLR